jgi:hypothetical protein
MTRVLLFPQPRRSRGKAQPLRHSGQVAVFEPASPMRVQNPMCKQFKRVVRQLRIAYSLKVAASFRLGRAR